MNIKKLTQKDRYGNMVSFEFEVPPMQEIPHPGMPMGTDTVPAWLTPGERVMNAEAERMYGPQLEAMNEQGRAIQRAQGGTIPEYAAGGCKVKYAAKGSKVNCNCLECSNTMYAYQGGPVYAQQGMSPDQLLEEYANYIRSGGTPDTTPTNATPFNVTNGIPYPVVQQQPGQLSTELPPIRPEQQPIPTDYEAEALMGVRQYPQVSQTPGQLSTELPPITPEVKREQVEMASLGRGARPELREYPEVPTTPGQLDAEPPQKYSDRDVNLRDLLVDQEGFKTKPYKDTEGNWTVGAGHKITDEETIKRLNNGESIEFTNDQLMGWFEKDVNTAKEGAQKNFSDFNTYSPKLQDALVSMNFQLGTAGTAKFKNFKEALANRDFETAKAELDNSIWATQTPSRVAYLKSVIDEEAAQRVGNKNTITSTSGQPVVDSRFGVESTYKGQDTTPEVPLPNQVPEMIDEFGIEQRDVAGAEGEVNPEVLQQKKISEYNAYADQEIAAGRKPESFDMWEFENYTSSGGRQAGTVSNEMAPPVKSMEEAATPVDEFSNISRDLQGEIQTEVVPEIDQGKPTPPDVKTSTAQQVIESNKNEPNPYIEGMNDADVETVEIKVEKTGQQEAQNNPQGFNTIMDWLKNNLGDLFDTKELARMGVMYLGSRALGYSHGGSLGFAAKNYIKRVDAKANNKQAVAQQALGKYTPESIKKYLETGNLSDLKAITKTELSKDFVTFNVKGKPVNGYWDKTTQKYYAIDSSGSMYTIPPNTPKFKEDTSATDYDKWKNSFETDANAIIDNAFPAGEKPELWKLTGPEVATQAVGYFKDQGYDIDQVNVLYNMDAITQKAIRSAATWSEANPDKQVMSIEPFLAQETLFAKVGPGFESLFMIDPNEDDVRDQTFVDPVKLATVADKLDIIARDKTEDATSARREKDIMIKKAALVWNSMSDKQKSQYSAGKGETGFYVFLNSLVSDGKVTEEELTVKGE